MLKSLSKEEIAKHNNEKDCWIIINNQVYDVTSFLADHPGGKSIIIKKAGNDATKEFNTFHNPEATLAKYGPKLLIGYVAGTQQPTSSTATSSSVVVSKPAKVSANTPSSVLNAFGEISCQYADPTWYQEWNSPYYNDSHRRFRAAIREFTEKEITPYCHEWDEAKKVPSSLWEKANSAGWLPAVIGPPWPTEYVGSEILGGVKPEEFNAFHELILIDELGRCGSGGVLAGMFAGTAIGLPPIMLFGSKYLKDKVVADCLSGRKWICLCITEPTAGSDVANIQATAKKTPDGKHYIVNGEKKWITNGVFADYFTVAVRTGGPGQGGLSFILVERTMPGVTTRQMNCQGAWSSGTTYITFDNVKVPAENLIGQENQAFKYIMYNFNHERWGIIVQVIRFSRVCYEEAFKYAFKRMTFGKRLIDHPVIRLKLANMIRQIEAVQAWLENITYQMTTMSHQEAFKLGGAMCLLKVQASTVFEFCAREASQIFGGLSYTRGGQAEKIERLYREVRACAIAGGSEEILSDFGIRTAQNIYERNQQKKSKL